MHTRKEGGERLAVLAQVAIARSMPRCRVLRFTMKASWLADGHLPAVTSHGRASSDVCSSYKGTKAIVGAPPS